MRIGIDATCWSNGRGFGRFARELLTAVARLNTGDEFVLLSDRQTAAEATFPPGWRVLVGDTSVAPSQAAAADGRRSLRDMLVMRRVAARERFDLIFFPAVYSYFPVGGRTPVLVTFHDVIAETLPHLIFHNRRSRFFWNLKCRAAARRSAAVVTVSNASREGLMRVFGLPEARVRVVSEAPSPVFGVVEDRTAQEAALKRHGLRPGERFLLSVGGISPHKNLDTLIAALGKLAGDARLSDVRLVLVGDYQRDVFRTCHADLMRQAERLGLAGRVHFPGYVPDEDLVHLYAAAQAFVFPSFLEGFGLPAVEAMACGAAVIASHRGSLPEVLDGAGELFDPQDAAALARALALVLTDDDHRRALQQKSRDRAKAFSWEHSARQAVEVFREFGAK